MNWTWTVRSRDGGADGLEFARAVTAGCWERVLIHAAPQRAHVEVRADDGHLVARANVDASGLETPIALLTLEDGAVARFDIWPGSEHLGLPVILAGGEVGILRAWLNSDDHQWWRWSVEFSNHEDRPADWSPPRDGTTSVGDDEPSLAASGLVPAPEAGTLMGGYGERAPEPGAGDDGDTGARYRDDCSVRPGPDRAPTRGTRGWARSAVLSNGRGSSTWSLPSRRARI